jgi:hypothetical protein
MRCTDRRSQGVPLLVQQLSQEPGALRHPIGGVARSGDRTSGQTLTALMRKRNEALVLKGRAAVRLSDGAARNPSSAPRSQADRLSNSSADGGAAHVRPLRDPSARARGCEPL